MKYARNYGGILQCMALQKTLMQKGYDVEVIRFAYRNKTNFWGLIKYLFNHNSSLHFSEHIKEYLFDLKNLFFGKKRMVSNVLLNKCRDFILQHINYTELCDEYTIGKLVGERKYDAIVIGSDKIWGAMGRKQLVYFGDWLPPFKGKLLSYAACSSRKEIPNYNLHKIGTLLSRFSAISVRDTHTYNLLKCYPNLQPQIVLDPTFLYDYNEIIVKQNTEPYILIYILGREIDGGHNTVIEKIKNEYGKLKTKAIVLADESTDIIPYVDEIYEEASPSDWVNLIYNASFIYTDSFHGTVFSIKFGKPFISYYKEKNRASRLMDLREKFNLTDQIISSINDININSLKLPDYDRIFNKIEILKKESLDFLNII